MADNKYTQAIEKAKSDLEQIEKGVKDIGVAISTLDTNLIQKMNKTFAKTPQEFKKQMDSVKKSVSDVTKKMNEQEVALKRQADLQYRYAKQKEQSEKWQFAQMAKATKEVRKMNDAKEKELQTELKLKKAREASLSKEMTARMVENVKNIGRTNDGLRKMASYYAQLEQSTRKAANAEEKAKIAREKAISRQLTGQMKEYVNSIGKTNDGLKKMNAYYKDLEKSTAKEAREKAKSAAANEKLNTAYAKLVANQQRAKNALRELIASEKASKNEIRAVQKEYDLSLIHI